MKKRLRENFLISEAIASTLFPCAIFFFLISQNADKVDIPLSMILLVSLFAIGFFFYYLIRVIFRRKGSALAFCTVCWIGCFAQPIFYDVIINKIGNAGGVQNNKIIVLGGETVCIIIFALLAALVFKNRQMNAEKYMIIFCIIIIIMNVPRIFKCIGDNSVTNSQLAEKDEMSFVIDYDLDSPDIYWIHADGMLGLDAVEKYFDHDESVFIDELEKRGFELNPSASFEAMHQTAIAIPVLTCPHAYDELSLKGLDINSRNPEVEDDIRAAMRVAIRNNEMLNAFSMKGYQVSAVTLSGYYNPPEGESLYLLSDTETPVKLQYVTVCNGSTGYLETNNAISGLSGMLHRFRYLAIVFSPEIKLYKAIKEGNVENADWIHDYGDLLSEDMMTFLFEKGVPDSKMPGKIFWAYGLYDALMNNSEKPKIVVVQDLSPHHPFYHDADGSIRYDVDSNSPKRYIEEHLWSEHILINTVDMIREVNPNAVIVIQADHGLHDNTKEDFIEAFGDAADEEELWNSVMSAVYIPEQYQNGDENYMMETPLNISRYLINNYVGENYKYLNY